MKSVSQNRSVASSDFSSQKDKSPPRLAGKPLPIRGAVEIPVYFLCNRAWKITQNPGTRWNTATQVTTSESWKFMGLRSFQNSLERVSVPGLKTVNP